MIIFIFTSFRMHEGSFTLLSLLIPQMNVPNSWSFRQKPSTKVCLLWHHVFAQPLCKVVAKGIVFGRAIPCSLICNITAWGLVIIAVFSCCWLSIVAFLIDEFNFAGILHRFARQMLLLQEGSRSPQPGVRARGSGVGLPSELCWHGAEPQPSPFPGKDRAVGRAAEGWQAGWICV